MSIRAKMRCMSVSHGVDDNVQVRLLATIPKKGLPNFEENQRFWKYTPNGEAIMTFKGEPPYVVTARAPNGEAAAMRAAYEVGSFYYVDMVKRGSPEQRLEGLKDERGLWTLQSRTDHLWSSTNVELDYRPTETGQQRAGTLKMGLSEEAEGAKEQLGVVAYGWDVTFTFAHGPEVD